MATDDLTLFPLEPVKPRRWTRLNLGIHQMPGETAQEYKKRYSHARHVYIKTHYPERRAAQEAERAAKRHEKPRRKWVRTAFPRLSIKRLPDETPAEFRRRYERERHAILKAIDPDFLTRVAAKMARFRKRQPAKTRGYVKAAEAKKPAHYKAIWLAAKHRRRIRKTAATGTFTPNDIKDILRLQKGRCALCRTDVRKRRSIDHIIPLALGGSNDRKNLQLLCRSCNSKKGARHPIEYAQGLGLLL